MPLQIIRKDLTTVCADAIVNTTNESMKGLGGVDFDIHAAAGKELDAACEKLVPLELGFAKITKGYGLNCKYIIHTSGPVYRDGRHGERALLRSCYLESLRLAKEHHCESVAFPLISAGTYGYPKEAVLHCAIQAISEFLDENEMNVYLCVFDRSVYTPRQPLMKKLRAYLYPESAEQEKKNRSVPYARMQRPNNEVCKASLLKADEPEPLCMVHEEAPSQEESLREYLKQMDKGFAQTLFDLIEAEGMTDVTCYKKANIDRRTFSKIRSNSNYKPSKQTAVAFAIALRLDLGAAQHLLATAGFTLSDSQLFDKIIRYFIQQKRYDVFEINEALFEFDQVLLGC